MKNGEAWGPEGKMPGPETKSASRGTTPGKPVSAKEGRINRIKQEPGQSLKNRERIIFY
jgi:hypothetical protein